MIRLLEAVNKNIPNLAIIDYFSHKLAVLILGVSFLVNMPLNASVDVPLEWSSVSIVTDTHLGNALVMIKGAEKLTEISIQINGNKMQVPDVEFDGILKPRLNTVQIISDQRYVRSDPSAEVELVEYISIKMQYGELSAFGDFPSVTFSFANGQYENRSQKIQVSKGVWQWYEKQVNEAVSLGGHLSELND